MRSLIAEHLGSGREAKHWPKPTLPEYAFIGRSNVGKSSLINRLVPGRPALEGDLSAASGAGRHTTTVSTLYELPGGGAIIDSPGVRGFAPPLPEPRWIASGFVEIERVGGDCRFADCLHDDTAGCAVESAAAAGRIHARAGECLLSATGIEGGLVYALSAPLRDTLLARGEAILELDLAPGRSLERLARGALHDADDGRDVAAGRFLDPGLRCSSYSAGCQRGPPCAMVSSRRP